MRLATVIIALWMSCVVVACARLGETQAQCEERYGQAVTNFPGCDDLVGAKVYLKDGVYINILFVKSAGRDPYAGMVIYSRMDPVASLNHRSIIPPEVTTNEETLLLGTVEGRWEGYAPAPGLARVVTKPVKFTSIDQPSFTQKQHDNAAQAVQKAAEALYIYRGFSSDIFTPKDLAHNGLKLFAFRVARGVAICSSEAVTPIKNWASDLISSRDRKLNPSNKRLSGF